MAYPKLPNPMPPLNSPEYVALARKIAVEMGAAEKAPRTILIAERRKAERKYQRLISRVLRLTEAETAKLVNPTVDDIIRVFITAKYASSKYAPFRLLPWLHYREKVFFFD